jgi:hypothetical protein
MTMKKIKPRAHLATQRISHLPKPNFINNEQLRIVECTSHSKSIGSVEVNSVVVNYLLSSFLGLAYREDIVNIFTEYTDNDDVLYRAHPNFQNGGAWYVCV